MGKKQMALTFDDGPTPGITDRVLDLLEQEGVRASFFLIGQQVIPETEYLVKREVAMGCSIENHSFTHQDMTKFSKEEIKEKGYFDPRENTKYLSKYTVIDDYGKDLNGVDKKYSYSIYLANKKVEKDWERSVMNKTKEYFKNLY